MIQLLPQTLLLIPLITGLAAFTSPRRAASTAFHLIGSGATLVAGIILAIRVFQQGPLELAGGLLYLDSLSAMIALIVSLVGFLAGIYSVQYMERELAEGETNERRLRGYYLWFWVFVFTMLLSLMAGNLGVMWVAIEATTLASALLVGFYDKKSSLEAAWKYVIIGTVGITLALIGTILVNSATAPLGEAGGLRWTVLISSAARLDPGFLRLAFLFALIGYGTKTGLAPMHTWLPDAHSQAPSPVSALLSGVSLNCAAYGLLRFHSLLTAAVGPAYSQNLLLIFGLISVAIAVPFILTQRDLKRLLAYSSIEHMGIIATGIGFGGWLGVYGAVLHLLNHSLTKSLMFLAAGRVAQHFRTREMARITGAMEAMPVTGAALLLGGLAILGAPPFGIFISEFMILSAGFRAGKTALALLLLLFLALIFAGGVYYLSKMTLGTSSARRQDKERWSWSLATLVVPLAMVLVLGLYIPPYLNAILGQVVQVIGGN